VAGDEVVSDGLEGGLVYAKIARAHKRFTGDLYQDSPIDGLGHGSSDSSWGRTKASPAMLSSA
jgi:hypothetical protein